MEIHNMQEAAAVYRKVEARLADKKAAYEQDTARDRQALEQLELVMLQLLKEAGVSAMNIPGVAEVKIVNKRVFGSGDWDLFFTWLVTNNKPELLQKRIHEANMQHYIDMNGGATLPPSINVHTEAVIKVLKAK
jgi:hypothetical protein